MWKLKAMASESEKSVIVSTDEVVSNFKEEIKTIETKKNGRKSRNTDIDINIDEVLVRDAGSIRIRCRWFWT